MAVELVFLDQEVWSTRVPRTGSDFRRRPCHPEVPLPSLPGSARELRTPRSSLHQYFTEAWVVGVQVGPEPGRAVLASTSTSLPPEANLLPEFHDRVSYRSHQVCSQIVVTLWSYVTFCVLRCQCSLVVHEVYRYIYVFLYTYIYIYMSLQTAG